MVAVSMKEPRLASRQIRRLGAPRAAKPPSQLGRYGGTPTAPTRAAPANIQIVVSVNRDRIPLPSTEE